MFDYPRLGELVAEQLCGDGHGLLGCAGFVRLHPVNESALLNLVLNATDVHCGGNANATASAIVTGGTGAYQFVWSNGDTTANLANLAAGNYTLTVTDDNGCFVNGSVNVIEPPTLTFAATIVDVTCQDQTDGSILTTSFGGSLPYSYAWNNGATTPNGWV